MTELTYSKTYPLDLDAIRRDNPLPDVAAGAGVKLIRAGNEWKACCPFHSEHTPSFTIFAGGQRAHCFGCGWTGDVLDFVQASFGVGLRDAAEMLGADTMPRIKLPPTPPGQNDAAKIAKAKVVWRSAITAEGTLAEVYLRSRAITIEPPMALRFAELAYPFENTGELHPCLVACISSPEGPLQGVQRTYLSHDGQGKADLSHGAKLSLGKVAGGAIRLAPLVAEMVLCSGVEDSLSLLQGLDRSVWAVPGDANLPRIQWPSLVKSVAIGADNDASGQKHSFEAAKNFASQGLEAKRFFPRPGHDFNSELMEATHECA